MKYGSQAASTRQRLLQYIPYLQEKGISVECLPLLGNDQVERIARGRRAEPISTTLAYARRLSQLAMRRNMDVIWIHSELFPYFPGLFERCAKIAGKAIIYDCDDAIFHMYDAHPDPWVRATLGKKLVPLLQSASLCLCGNAYLRNYVSRYCKRTEILPTVVDTHVYVPLDKRREKRPLIGWIGSPSTFSQMRILLPTIADHAARRGTRLRIVGGGPEAVGFPNVEAVEWSEDSEVRQVQQMDIGIMPVPDGSWARGKCGYKLIQYMACGLPVIASPVGVNTEIVQDGESGFLARSGTEWEKALDRLIDSPELRARMGAKGRERVEKVYSLEVHSPRLSRLLQSVAATKSPPR